MTRNTCLCTNVPSEHDDLKMLKTSSAKILLSTCAVMDLVANSLDAQDLMRFCFAGTRLWSKAGRFTAVAAEEHHGLRIVDGSLADLCAFDCVPRLASFSLASGAPDVVALNGNPFANVKVGGTRIFILAQAPPRLGDRWSHPVCLQRGSYSVVVDAWRNSCQGVLDLFFDGKRITPEQGLDWCVRAWATTEHTETFGIAVKWTGTHQLVGEVCRSNSQQAAPNNFWMCLRSLSVSRV